MNITQPIEIDMTLDEDKQIISMYEQALGREEMMKENAVREVMRLRDIIKGCEQCRTAANATRTTKKA